MLINEVMASNAATLADEDGDHEDWIELLNAGDEALNLAGYGLSDDVGDPFRFIFPDVVIGAGETMLVWASGKNRTQAGAPLHTIFSISSAGEEVLLSAPDGTLLDMLEPTNIPTDISIGRLPHDLTGWYFFDEPTPGAPNMSTPWQGIQAPPAFSHPGGFYGQPFSLSLSADAEAVIYYTLDGSEPDSANVSGSSFQYKNQYPMHPGDPVGPFLDGHFQTHVYHEPIPVEDQSGSDGIHQINTSYTRHPLNLQVHPMQGMVVRARAYREGYLPSEVFTHTYIVGEEILGRFDLPVVSLTLPDTSLFDYYRGIHVAGKAFDDWRADNPSEELWPAAPANWGYRGNDWERRLHLELFTPQGHPLLRQNLGARIHGGWSRSNHKKSFRVYARNVYDTNNEIEHVFFPGYGRPLDGHESGVFKRLLFRAGGNGNRMIRDVVSQDLMWGTHVGVQRASPAVFFVNGVYWGILNFRDRQDRYHIAYEYDIDPDNVIIIDSPHAITGSSQLEEGEVEDLELFNQLFRLIVDKDMSNDIFYQKAREQLCIDSYIDYYLLFIYLANSDWGGRDNVGAKHFRFWRARETSHKPFQDGKWRVMVWDFDNGFSDYNYDLLTDVFDPGNDPSAMILGLAENDEFKHLFINRLADLMNAHFLPARALDILDQRLQAVAGEALADQDRWLVNPIHNVSHMQNFLQGRPVRQRMEAMDLFGLPDTSFVTLRTNPQQGHIRINSLHIADGLPGVDDPGNWTGNYFHGVPIQVEAIPGPGMIFSHWEGLPPGTPARTTIDLVQDTVLRAHFWDGVIHYWHFNYLPDEDFLESVNADYSLFPEDALITYPGEGPGFMDRVLPGTSLNAHMGAQAGYALRVRNPSDTRDLVIRAPSQGFGDLSFSYAVQRTSHGPHEHALYFSSDNGDSWQLIESGLPVTMDYQLQSFDLSAWEGTADNPDLLLKISFMGEGAGQVAGNTRFDNMVLKVSALDLPGENLPPASMNMSYKALIEARHGQGPYQYSLTGGRLPEGLVLTGNGIITGTPQKEGSWTFEVEVKDARQAHASATYQISVFGEHLIHYWHFNDLKENPGDTVYADYSATQQPGHLYYHGSGPAYMDRVEGTPVNNWSDVPGGYGLRVRNPSANRELRFVAPTSGFDHIRFSFAVHRTNNGARWQVLQYSPDGGHSWHDADSPFRITTDYQVRQVDLRSISELDDNDELMFRILFLGPEAANSSGNNRFDNIAVHGIPPPEHIHRDELFLYPNPVSDGIIYFLAPYSVSLYDLFGRRVHRQENTTSVVLPPLSPGIYILVSDDGQYARIVIP